MKAQLRFRTAGVAALVLTAAAWADFGAGHLVVLNTTSNAGVTNALQLNEYDVSGPTALLVSTYAISGVAAPKGVDNDRQLKRSADGRLLTFAAYAAPVGQAIDLYTTSAATAPRAIVSVDLHGAANTLSLGAALYDGLEITAAATRDGSEFWVAGENRKNNATDISGGPRYVRGDGLSYNLYTPADDGTGTASTRGVGIYNGQLYYSSGSSSFGSSKGVNALGAGVTAPTGDTKLTRTVLNGGNSDSVNDFVLFDLDGNGSSDVAYAARKGGVAKFAVNGTTATYLGQLTNVGLGDMKSITAQLFTDGNGVVEANIFAVAGGGGLYKITDTNVLTGTFSGALPAPYIAAGDNAGYQFGGLDFAPTPEPASLALLGLLAVLRSRR